MQGCNDANGFSRDGRLLPSNGSKRLLVGLVGLIGDVKRLEPMPKLDFVTSTIIFGAIMNCCNQSCSQGRNCPERKTKESDWYLWALWAVFTCVGFLLALLY